MLQLAVCDDEAVCLRQTVDILRAALGDTPHQLKTFQNAPAVLHMLAEDGYRPDIAVLDICMGELDGISLAKEINRLAPACRVKSWEMRKFIPMSCLPEAETECFACRFMSSSSPLRRVSICPSMKCVMLPSHTYIIST